MKYSVCIELPKNFYNITNLSKEDVELIASAFEDRLDNFFLSGIEYDIKDVRLFKVFSYDNSDEYSIKINASEEVKGEGYFLGHKVLFKAQSLSKLFPDVTNEFIRKFSADRKTSDITFPYVNKARIDELRAITNQNYDLKRVIKLCDEINHTFNARCYIATIILVRALLDHIPPLFGKRTFSEVANNYGPKSFKDTMQTLDNISRKIADLYLHTHISHKEETPLEQQVNFSQPVDLLLSEIIKIAK